MRIQTLLALAIAGALHSAAADKKIVFIAGSPSHPPGEHEHRAGCLLLSECLKGVKGVTSVVHSNGWPNDPGAFDGAAAVVIYSDGGGGHPFLREGRLKEIGALMDKAVGLAAIHYACEPTKENGQKEFIEWIGGCFETFWSVNPHWDANFTTLPDHPITRGVRAFSLRDEWYFHMRFRDAMKGVTPILSDVPPESTMNRGDGPHSGNPAVREAVSRREPQPVAWAAERANGGRGFGFTGGHFHKNWGDDQFRKVVLNAILWIAKTEVPAGGVDSKVTRDQLAANQDDKSEPKVRPSTP